MFKVMKKWRYAIVIADFQTKKTIPLLICFITKNIYETHYFYHRIIT